MGLDMYLEAEFYVSNWNHSGEEAQKRFAGILSAAGIDLPEGVKSPDYGNVVVEAAYWRKVNAIHAWFVENVQDGKDECQRSYVEADTLQELVDLCERILATVKYDGEPDEWGYAAIKKYDKALVEELSPRSGFFFGSTDVDGYYFAGLKETVDQLKPWLERVKAARAAETYDKVPEFYYRASW